MPMVVEPGTISVDTVSSVHGGCQVWIPPASIPSKGKGSGRNDELAPRELALSRGFLLPLRTDRRWVSGGRTGAVDRVSVGLARWVRIAILSRRRA